MKKNKASVTWEDEEYLKVQAIQMSKISCENTNCEQSFKIISDQSKAEDSNLQMNQNNITIDQTINTTINNESFQDLRIGEQFRQRWVRMQIDQKNLKSSPSITQNDLNQYDYLSVYESKEEKESECEKNQDEDQVQTQSDQKDQAFQESNNIEDSSYANNSKEIVGRFYKGQQIQCRSNSRKVTRKIQTGECQSPEQSKSIEPSEQNNRSHSNSLRYQKGPTRFKTEDPTGIESSGFKKKKNMKMLTYECRSPDSQENENKEDPMNLKSQHKIHRTSQEVWKNSFFHILIFFNRFIYRNKLRLIYFKPQDLLKNQWNAINDLELHQKQVQNSQENQNFLAASEKEMEDILYPHFGVEKQAIRFLIEITWSYPYYFTLQQDFYFLGYEIFMLCHIFACAWFKLGEYQQSIGVLNNWVAANDLVNASILSQYISSIYFSIITVGTIGYGDIAAKSDCEKVFISFMAIFTSIIFGYILTNIQNVYKEYYYVKKIYIKHLAELNNYLFSRDVNPHLQQMARKYLKYVHTQNFQKGVHPNQTLNLLSKFLREEIIEEIFQRSIKNIPFLQQFSQQFLNALSLKMKEIIYGPDEMIMKSGSYQVPQIYYILKGKVDVYLDQTNRQNLKQSVFQECDNFCEYKENQSFGQYEFISQVHQSSVNAKSLEITTIHQIALNDFIEVLNQFSNDKEKYLELKDKLNLNENFTSAKVYCQSCKSSQHLLKDCPLFFYKPSKYKIIRLYNIQQELERQIVKRSPDRLVLNSLAFQQEIEDDCLFFREENQYELGSMIQLEAEEDHLTQKPSKKKSQKKSQDMLSLNVPQIEKLANGSRISITIPQTRGSFQLNSQGNNSQQMIQTENKIAEQETEESKIQILNDSSKEIQQQSTLNSQQKLSTLTKIDENCSQRAPSSKSSSSSQTSSDSELSLDDQFQQKQNNKNSISGLNENGMQNKSRMSITRINHRQEFQKKATLLSARTKKNWSCLDKNQNDTNNENLNDQPRPSQLLFNDPKIVTQIKKNYKRLITIGQMKQVLEIMQMQNAQNVVKQIIEHSEEVASETIRSFKVYMTHNNIGNIIRSYQKFIMKERLRKKIIKSINIDNPFILKNFMQSPTKTTSH